MRRSVICNDAFIKRWRCFRIPAESDVRDLTEGLIRRPPRAKGGREAQPELYIKLHLAFSHLEYGTVLCDWHDDVVAEMASRIGGAELRSAVRCRASQALPV